MKKSRLVAGVMTGTSIDGMDLALIEVRGRGLELRVALRRQHAVPLGGLAPRLRAAADQEPLTAADFAALAWEFGELHAKALDELLEGVRPDLIVAHGQTLFHRPPLSLQLLNAAPIANRFGCHVVFDLRQADLAAGGHGAPITPLADWILFRDPVSCRAIVNLGGFCNLTLLPGDERACIHDVRGADLCACNQILDAVARRALGAAFDENGSRAARGTAEPRAVEGLESLLHAQQRSARSLGTGDEALAWVEEMASALAPDDLAASACRAIGGTIGAAIRELGADEVVLAGGGARNAALVAAIAAGCRRPVRFTSELGVPIECREAVAMAVLGALAEDGVEITLAAVTGRAALAGRSGSWAG